MKRKAFGIDLQRSHLAVVLASRILSANMTAVCAHTEVLYWGERQFYWGAIELAIWLSQSQIFSRSFHYHLLLIEALDPFIKQLDSHRQ